MLRHILKSKIMNAVLTKKELHYSGSIGIDKVILKQSDMIAGEKVQVLNFNNGQRFETYIIEEESHSGTIALYGPAARLGEIGDKLCILSYAFIDDSETEQMKPKIVFVNKQNKIK
ncbi:aspartate 1-decarboxylase [bacterium]|nr:aspartate 1-decarboxylase [bacterium]